MKNTISIVALVSISAAMLSACDKPTVVNVPAPQPTIVVPGPAGPAGTPGVQGKDGVKGEPGKNSDGTTVVVVPPPAPVPTPPPAPAPSN
jgi:hypothetical protein